MGKPILMTLIKFLIAFALAVLLPLVARAGQWAEVGDKQLREDVELLHDVGIINGPVLSWPLPWGQIAEEVTQASTASDISPFLQAAARRVAARMNQRRSEGLRPDVEIKLQVTNGETLVRDFSDSARSNADASIRFENSFENTTLVYGIGYQDNQTYQGTKFGGKVVFDNLYVTQKVGNWLFYGGTVEQWWGPSGEQSLMMSNSARPYPKIGFKRIETDPFESKWLSWIGPWRFEASAGVLTGPRQDYQNVLVLSQRVEVEPFKHFQLSVSRFAQVCGKNNPTGLPDRKCSFGTILKSLALTGSANSGTVATDSSNSGAEIDMRYARPIGNVVMAAFIHLYAEDSAFTATSQMAGVSVTGHTEGLGTWKIGAEAADTLAFRTHDFAFGTRTPGDSYLNAVYNDGYSYRGKPIAFSLDGDSRLLSLYGSLTTKRNWRYSGAFRYADINLFNTLNYRISKSREKIWIGEAGLTVPTKYGDFDIKSRFQSDSPNTFGRKVTKSQIEAGWVVGF
jgi:hypothetical protein